MKKNKRVVERKASIAEISKIVDKTDNLHWLVKTILNMGCDACKDCDNECEAFKIKRILNKESISKCSICDEYIVDKVYCKECSITEFKQVLIGRAEVLFKIFGNVPPMAMKAVKVSDIESVAKNMMEGK
jgi:hypothetical protein